MKVILEIGKDDLERIRRALDHAHVVQESPSGWQLSFSEKLFQKTINQSINHATVKIVREAARRHWPVTCDIHRSYGPGEFNGFGLTLHWIDAAEERWCFNGQPIEAETSEGWKQRAHFRLKWLCFSGESLNRMTARAFDQMLIEKATRDKERHYRKVTEWFHGQGLSTVEKPAEPVYDSPYIKAVA